jgi:hypothetical protein
MATKGLKYKVGKQLSGAGLAILVRCSGRAVVPLNGRRGATADSCPRLKLPCCVLHHRPEL